MPGLNGLEVTRQVVQRSPRTRVVMLSMYSNEAYVLESPARTVPLATCLRSGAATDLIQAVREVVAGRRYLESAAAPNSHRSVSTKGARRTIRPYEALTTREREVLQLAAEGRTNADIAAALFVSPRTVETHRATPDAQTGPALPGRPNPLRPTSWYLAAGAVSGWELPICPLLFPPVRAHLPSPLSL